MSKQPEDQDYRPRGALVIAGILTGVILFTWIAMTLLAVARG
ncbi:MAG TPA: hypothetical protein VFA48_04280 [Gammaproteobacteria bacterium]|nr:hypothetical protein [Gammaproteobacteria bacterium]